MTIPKGWTEKKLGEIADVARGKFSVRPRNDPRYYGGDIPFVQTGDVTASGKFLRQFSQTLNQDGLSVSKLFPKNTILMTIAANIGDITINQYDVAFPDSVVGINAKKEKSNYLWLYYYLGTCKDYLDSRATQNAQKNINLEVLRPLIIPVPPLPEQIKIADILSTWDRAIEAQEKLITNSETLKKALMQQLLTGKKRLNGFSGAWKEVRFIDVFTSVATKNYQIQSTQFLCKGKFPIIDQGKDLIAGFSDEKEKVLKNNGIIVFGDHTTILKFIDFDFIVGADGTKLLRNKKGNLKYLFYYLELKNVRQEGYKRHFSILSQIKISLPSPHEQNAIANILSDSDREIELQKQKLSLLKQEKSALMQDLLTGKRRVNIYINLKEEVA